METKTANNKRIIDKANRNLFRDQILFINLLARKKGKSESEILREIIDFYKKEMTENA